MKRNSIDDYAPEHACMHANHNKIPIKAWSLYAVLFKVNNMPPTNQNIEAHINAFVIEKENLV